MKIMSGLRISVGALIAALSVMWLGKSLWRIITAIGRDPFYGLDGPPPLSFFYYAGAPITALVTLLAGIAILRRWWLVLATCFSWFLASAISELVWLPFILNWKSLLTPFPIGQLLLLLAATVASGLASKSTSRASANQSKDTTYFAWFSPITLLALASAITYLARALFFMFSPEATWAVNRLRGTEHTFWGEDDVVVISIVGLGLAIIVLIGAARALKGSPALVNIGLAAMASLSLTGILATLDMIVLLELFRHWHYGIQEGVAFLTSITALVLGLLPRRRTTTFPA